MSGSSAGVCEFQQEAAQGEEADPGDAEAVSPFRPEKMGVEAGRLMIQHIDECVV